MYLLYIKKKIPKIYAFFGPLNGNFPLIDQFAYCLRFTAFLWANGRHSKQRLEIEYQFDKGSC